MSYIYLYHHLGLGDHIICNGMVRHFAEKHDTVFVFCKSHNADNIRYMFRDEQKIKVLAMEDDSFIISFIKSNPDVSQNLVVAGLGDWVLPSLPHIDEYVVGKNMTFDRAFYEMAGVPFEYRFSKFYFERNEEEEDKVFKTLNPSGESYIFLQDDPSRGYSIDREKIPQGIKIIENDKRFKLFDYLRILENAEEIHMMESSMQNLINSYSFDKPKIFLHKYIRDYGELMTPDSKHKYSEVR